jgi:DNA gyrase/topoisomerase IV subunit B
MTKESEIQILSSIEGIRSAVGMYLGPAENQVLQTVRETLQNSVDEFLRRRNSYICLVVQTQKESQTYTVIDRGSGIPVAPHPKTGKSILTEVLTKIHAGSNFNKQSEKKAKTGGKHGTGISCVTATSSLFTCYTCNKGIWYTQSFKKGKRITKVEKCLFPKQYKKFGALSKQGTIIEYTPDYSILPKTKLAKKQIYDLARYTSGFNTGLKLRVIYDGKLDETFLNKAGVVTVLNIFKESLPKKTEYIGKPYLFEHKSGDLQIGLQWSSLEGEHVLSFVNSLEVSGLGSHVQGAYNVISKVFKEAKGRGSDFSAADLREGMLLVIHYKCDDDEYAGQNKEKLNSASATARVSSLLEKDLQKWAKDHDKLVRKICKRATILAKAKQEAKKITKAAATLKVSKRKGNPLGSDKLAMCDKNCPAEERELFVCEGTSASGSLKAARTVYNQIVLGLRGKPLNVAKTPSIAKDLANKEIRDLLIALGADPREIAKGEKLSEISVNKIVIMTDSDVDGPLRGKTKILTLDGENPTIATLAKRWKDDPTPFWVLGRDSQGNLVPTLAYSPRVTKVDSTGVELTFDNGTTVICHESHKWVSLKETNHTVHQNGHNYIKTKYLKVGDRLDSVYLEQRNPTNHKIISIRKISYATDKNWYCLTVPETGNFFVDDGKGNGILSSNCHIRILINSILWKYAPGAFDAKMVFYAKMPLFQAAWRESGEDKRIYGNSLKEIQKQAPKSAHVTRFKGLGEMTAEQIEPFFANEKTRELVAITSIDSKKILAEYELLVGANTQYRKQLLGLS